MIQRIKKKATVTTATITHVEKRHGQRSAYYLLHLQYKTIDTGAIYSAQTVSTSKKHLAKGTLALMFLRAKPAMYNTDFGKRLYWVVAFGLVFCVTMMRLGYWLLHLQYIYKPD